MRSTSDGNQTVRSKDLPLEFRLKAVSRQTPEDGYRNIPARLKVPRGNQDFS